MPSVLEEEAYAEACKAAIERLRAQRFPGFSEQLRQKKQDLKHSLDRLHCLQPAALTLYHCKECGAEFKKARGKRASLYCAPCQKKRNRARARSYRIENAARYRDDYARKRKELQGQASETYFKSTADLALAVGVSCDDAVWKAAEEASSRRTRFRQLMNLDLEEPTARQLAKLRTRKL